MTEYRLDTCPFVASRMTVQPDWIDYNGHLNMAYYNVLFDRSIDELFDTIGIGRAYLDTSGHSVFTVEAHVRYVREIGAADAVRIAMWLVDYDPKRLIVFAQMHHADEGWLSATSETISIHVDMTARRTCPFPAAALDNLRRFKEASDRVARPDGIGRRIALSSR
jgi:acyl-CoA thioester hydrolase